MERQPPPSITPETRKAHPSRHLLATVGSRKLAAVRAVWLSLPVLRAAPVCIPPTSCHGQT